ncbi:uncharacterized protein LOC134537793 isoform X2 [Bacillus rossius redtenbacheri]
MWLNRNVRWCLLFLCAVLLVLWVLRPQDSFAPALSSQSSSPKAQRRSSMFSDFDNLSGSQTAIVPNIVHFILFSKDTLDFTSFLSMVSALKVQRPEKLLIHTDSANITGRYWDALNAVRVANTSVQVVRRDRPSHVFGQPLSSVYHASDVARIQLLMEWGGVYLDTDVLVLRPLDRFLRYEMTVGWPPDQFIGTQILIAHRGARLLPLWLDGYRKYHPRDWYYNAGQFPTEQILLPRPGLAHRVPHLFGVDNLSKFLYGPARWPRWRAFFTLHLLARHPPAPRAADEGFVRSYRTPFGEIARWLLYKLHPRVAFQRRDVTASRS